MLSPNTLLQNRYRIKRILANKGGMGVVYEAEAVHLGRTTVAVKETRFDEDWLRKQFEQEATMLAELRHPALPKVTDHFSQDGGQFLVMEFIPGEDLEEMLANRGKPFDWPQVMEWADRLLDALVYIHSQYPPVIHRDIKPSNLKLTPRGEILLLDFGLAKKATTPTRPGKSLHAATPGFAPPEQIKGTGTDVRCDIYSLGATLYNLMTGEFPSDAKLRAEMMAVPMPDPLRPAHFVNPQIPLPISVVIARAMAVDRDRRYPTAVAMREAFQQARHSIEEEAREEQRRKEEAAREEQRRKEEAARLAIEQQRQAEDARRRVAAEAERIKREETERQLREQAVQLQKEKEQIEARLREETARRQQEESARRKKEQEAAELRQQAEAERQRQQEAERQRREVRERELAELRRREPELRKEASPNQSTAPQGKDHRRLIALAGALLAVCLLGGYWIWKSVGDDGQQLTQNALTATPTPKSSPLAAAQPVEILRYALMKADSTGGFRLRFTPRRDGYLYLVALDENDKPITLLTNRHAYDAKARANRLTAETELVFPSGTPLTFGAGKSSAPVTLIFSPVELKTPAFLDAADLRELTPAEQTALAELKRRSQARSPKTALAQDGETMTAISAGAETLVFEIVLRRQ